MIRDAEILSSMRKELERQRETLMMIPSENYASEQVIEAIGSVLTNKYSEGYSGKRYYQGNVFADEIERIAVERAKKLFGAEHANVQPLSGSPANMAVYNAVLKPNDKIMGLRLDMGGHLTHGHTVNFSAKYFKSAPYVVDKKTCLLDMDIIRKLAIAEKPKMIISGFTAYPRTIDFKAFHEIAEEVGAYSLADISHIAGLIAGKAHPSPFPFTDFVMTTTHKTLRGPRGAIVFSRKQDRLAVTEGLDEKESKKEKDLAGKLDRSVFPGLQGGPHDNIVAAIAIALKEAGTDDFRNYASQTVRNAKALAHALMDNGMKLVTDGTDNHLILIDLSPQGIGLGKEAAVALEEVGIVANCNTVPYDPSTPFKPSGLRMGTPALTTRGLKESEMKEIGLIISKTLKNLSDKSQKEKSALEIKELCKRFPIYKDREF